MLIDTHFHLDLMDNMKSLVGELCTTDVGILAVGTTPKAYEKEMGYCFTIKNIMIGLGMHPQLIADREQEIELFLKLAKKCRYIGEVGLDFNSDYIASKDKQISCLQRIATACAHDGDKVLSIHSVKAAGAVIDVLNDYGAFRSNICIFHWFTGSTAERKRAIEAGAYFSINPRMLSTKNGQETIRTVPPDKLLLETDAPFAMKINTITNLRKELGKLITVISEIRNENMNCRIEENTMKVFS